MSAELTGQEALTALVDAQQLLTTLSDLQQRTTELGLRLQRARDRAETQAREALDLIKRVAETDPRQLGVGMSLHALGACEVASSKVAHLEREAVEVVRRYEEG